MRQAIPVAILPVVGIILPTLVLSVAGWQAAAGVAGLSAMAAILASLTAERSVALMSIIGVAVASALAVLAGERPWLAAMVMGASAAASGLPLIRNHSHALITSAIAVDFVLFTGPQATAHPLGSAMAVAGVMAVAGLLGFGLGIGIAALLPRTRHSGRPAPEPSPSGRAQEISRPRTAGYIGAIGILTAVGTWCAMRLDLGYGGAWLVLTILVVYQPYLQDGWAKALQRIAGTFIGFLVSIGIAAIHLPDLVVYAVAVVCAGMAVLVMLRHLPYWQYAAMLTVAIVLMQGGSTAILETARERLGATLAGAVAAMILMLVLLPAYRSSARAHAADHY